MFGEKNQNGEVSPLSQIQEKYDGILRQSPHDPKRIEAYLPSQSPQNHAANLLPLNNGDLLCVWFSGTQEGIRDISIYMSRLNKGEIAWSIPVKLSEDPARSEQNPVLFLDPSEKLWLLYTAQKSGNQDAAIVRYRTSVDQGYSWSEIKELFDQQGIFVRQPIIVLANGEWLLPIFHCQQVPGEKWVGDNDTSAVKISADQGQTWTEYPVPNSVGCVHMNVNLLQDGSLLALYRSRWADYIYQSCSYDSGRNWTEPTPTILPNNNSSIQFITLKNGHLALVFNNISATKDTERRASLYDEIEDEAEILPANKSLTSIKLAPNGKTAFWGTPRAPMTIALSEDKGKTWRYIRNIEIGDGYCMSNNSQEKLNREFSYPSIKQTSDGKIHIAFTYFRQTIKYVQITEDWIKEQ